MNDIQTTSREAGFALPAAVLSLLVVGVLVTGGFYMAQQEQRIGIAGENAQRALYLAERGLTEVVENWDASTFGGLTAFTSTTVTDTLDTGIWSVEVTKLSPFAYLLDGSGTMTQGNNSGSRRLGMIVKSTTAQIDPPAALLTQGGLRFVGKATVNGLDNDPSNWPGYCGGSLTNKPGIMTNDADEISYNANQASFSGTPPILEDLTIADSTFTQFGDLTWDDLTAMADITLSPGNFNSIGPTTTNGVCNTSNNQNWGDPTNPANPCGGYFPIIHISGNGNSKINGGGIGQGILLVDDNIWAGGGFEFYGIIIVQGMFETGGSGNRVIGGVMAKNADLEEQKLSGGSVVQYSSCAVNRAILNSAGLTSVSPITSRSWVDLSNLGGE